MTDLVAAASSLTKNVPNVTEMIKLTKSRYIQSKDEFTRKNTKENQFDQKIPSDNSS